MKHFGITRAQFFALGRIDAHVAGMIGRFTLRGANRWLEEAHPRDVGFVREAFPAAGTHRCNPSAPTEARVVGTRTVRSTTRGVTYRRRFLLVRTGAALDWVEALPGSIFGGAVEAPAMDAQEVAPSAPRATIVAAFNAYVARRGSAW